MLLKDKIKKNWATLERFLLLPFCLANSFALVLISIIGLDLPPISSGKILLSSIIFALIFLFIWFKRLNEKNIAYKIILKSSWTIFILGSFSVFILNYIFWIDTEFKVEINLFLATILSFCVLIIAYVKRYEIEEKLNIEKNEEIKTDISRDTEFLSKYSVINQIPILGKVAKFFFRDGLAHSIILLTVIFSGLVLRIILAQEMVIHPDEIYTHLVTQGLFAYGDIGTTVSGVQYLRTPFFNLINSIPYYFIENKFLELRFFNIFVTTFFILGFYIINRKIFNKEIALLATTLISLSWYLTATFITARSYNILIWASFFSIVFLFFLLKAPTKEKRYAYAVLTAISSLIVFFEGHSLGFFHLVLLGGAFITYFFLKHKASRKYLIYFLGTIFIILCLYFSLIAPDYFVYLFFNTFSPMLRIEQIKLFGSFLSYYNFNGILYLALILIFSLIIKDTKIRVLSIFFISILLIQGYFWGRVSIDVRHFSDLILPMYVIVSYVIYILWKIRLKVVSLLIATNIFGVSLLGIYGIYTQKVTWSPYYPDSWEYDMSFIPESATIVTDYPDLVNFYRENNLVYAINQNPSDHLYRDINLSTEDPLEKYSELEKVRFKEYIEKEIQSRYVLENKQEFAKYSGIPKVMNIYHLIDIIKKSDNSTIYFVVTHNFYDPTVQKNNPELYNFILRNTQILKSERSYKNYFDDQSYPYSYNRRLTILQLSLDNALK